MITVRIEVDEDQTRKALVQVVNTNDSAVALYTIMPGSYEDVDLEAGWHIEVEHDEIEDDD